MNGQSNNRILPIKSLLENLKQESKKQYLQLEGKITATNPYQNNHSNAPQTHREHHINDNSNSTHCREQKKGISLNKNTEKNNHHHYGSRETSQNFEQGFNFYVPKKDKNNCERANRFPNHPQEPFRIDYPSDHYGYSNKTNKSEQIIYHQIKHDIKVGNKNCDTTHKFGQQMERESSTLTDKLNSKFQEETRSYSKFEKMESQPIFKDELTKIKTELFHKEAMLFTKTQELEEKDKIIQHLQEKIELKDKKNQKIPSEVIDKLKNMETIIKNKDNEIQLLKHELDQSKELYSKYEEDTATNYTLINLKLRQYEAEERQKQFQISELKEKQKRKYEQQEKMIKTLKQLIKEKEDMIAQIKELSNSNLQKALTAQTTLKQKQLEFTKQLDIKETFIRQLSAQIGDLKRSLKSMEERIREMIEDESEMRQISNKFNEAKTLYKQKEKLNEVNISDLKNRIGELNEIVFKRESSLIAYKEKNVELEEKLKKATQSSRTNSPPPRSTSSSTSKLIKDNERLSAIAKDFDRRLYQSYKLNEALNQEIVKRDLQRLNTSCFSRYGKDIE